VTLHVLADPHLGNPSPDLEARKAEAFALMEEVAGIISDDPLLILGDLFEKVKPPAWALTAVLRHLGYEDTYLLGGNHDTDEHDGISPLDVLAERGNFRVIRRPELLTDIGGFDIIAVPNVRRAWFAAAGGTVAEQYSQMTAQLTIIIDDLLAKCDRTRPIILACHNTIAGAKYNSDTQPNIGDSSEFMLPLSVVARPELECVLAGHVHKPQTIEGACPVIYVGSSTLHDFGEEGQPCIMLSREVSGANIETHLKSPLEFRTFDINALECNTEGIGRCFVRLSGSLPSGAESLAEARRAEVLLEQAGALKVGKSVIKYTSHAAVQSTRMTADMSPEKALEEYIELVGGDYATRRDDLLEKHRELVKEGVGA